MTRLIPALTLAILAAGPAWAQSQTGTGGGPATTATAPNTSAVGRTMPPSSGAGADTANAKDRTVRTEQQKQDDKISRGICIGCGPK